MPLGKIFVLEGIPGAGKTTLIHKVNKKFFKFLIGKDNNIGFAVK